MPKFINSEIDLVVWIWLLTDTFMRVWQKINNGVIEKIYLLGGKTSIFNPSLGPIINHVDSFLEIFDPPPSPLKAFVDYFTKLGLCCNMDI